ncbi:MAG: hypothetical protein K1X79_12310 [Oligoflexia bacterium]|nr:hypothetical protein [Oligoflexia bacterium]
MSVEAERKHYGELHGDSPALYAILQYAFPQQLDLLALAYHVAWHNGGQSEAPIVRAEGVSFNPRPARIVSLLLSDGYEKSPLTLCAAFLSYASCPSKAAIPSHLESAWELAQMALINNSSPPLTEAGCRIKLCREIDSLRHLHMTNLGEHQRLAVAQASAAIAEEIIKGANAQRLASIYRQILARRLP